MKEIQASRLDGVRYVRLNRLADRRGSFAEIWRESSFGPLAPRLTGQPDSRFVQANLSTSAQGVLRGLHYHRRQLDYWTVVAGRAFVALVDVRPVMADPTAGPLVETRELSSGEGVVIPAGVAHGFLALEQLSLLYLVTNEYDGFDELGFAWNDPEVGVPWPVVEATDDGKPVLSDRDLTNPSLRALIDRLRQG